MAVKKEKMRVSMNRRHEIIAWSIYPLKSLFLLAGQKEKSRQKEYPRRLSYMQV